MEKLKYLEQSWVGDIKRIFSFHIVSVCLEVWGYMINEPWHHWWHRHCMSCFRNHLRRAAFLRSGKNFIRLKKPSLQLSLSKFVVKSMKTVLGSSWMSLTGWQTAAFCWFWNADAAVIQICVVISGVLMHFCLFGSWLPQGPLH